MTTIKKLHRSHEKAIYLLSLIGECNKRIAFNQSELNRYDNTKDWMQPIKLMHQRRDFTDAISRYETIRSYLVKRYTSLVVSIDLNTNFLII